MRQVPSNNLLSKAAALRLYKAKKTKLLFIGWGRLAKHLVHYLYLCENHQASKHLARSTLHKSPKKSARFFSAGFYKKSLQRVEFDVWHHKGDPKSLEKTFLACDYALLCTTDQGLLDLTTKYSFLNSKKSIHFSGSIALREPLNFHPLMSFTDRPLSISEYQTIPFICFNRYNKIKAKKNFKIVFPLFSNPIYFVHPEKKSLYHALCVLSGNFTSLLWQITAFEFTNALGLPETVLRPYMERVFLNMNRDLKNSLTGPLVRGDYAVLKKNYQALPVHLKPLYFAFVHAFNPQIKERELEVTTKEEGKKKPRDFTNKMRNPK